MELSDEAKAEIAAAVKILREDGLHIHRSYKAFLKSQETPESNPEPAKTEPEPDKPTEGEPPPADKKNDPPKRASLWWGERE